MIPRYKAFLIALLLAACTPRGELGYLIPPDQGENVETIFVATSRTKDSLGNFGPGRSRTLSYASFEISIPNAHKPGEVEWPKGPINPATDFAIVDQKTPSSAAQFQEMVEKAFRNPQATDENGTRDIVVFIHGYNNNYAESLYRVAQLKHDYNQNAPTILYSWPSAARPRLYVYDRDSSLFARDGLEELLNLIANSRVDKISMVAHSMGAELLMETLRQIYRDGNPTIRAKIASVTLISPDIDVDLFNEQVAHLIPLPQPFTVFGSSKDEALKLLSILAGEPDRVGNNMDPAKIENGRIKTFDLSQFANGKDYNHFILANSAALIMLINRFEETAGEVLPTL